MCFRVRHLGQGSNAAISSFWNRRDGEGTAAKESELHQILFNCSQGNYESVASYGCGKKIDDAIKAGCDVNGIDKDGNRPIHLAVEGGRLDYVQRLLAHKVELDVFNNKGLSPLMISSKKGSESILQYLLKQGANVNAANNSGKTALHYAASCGSLEALKRLIESKAKLDYQDFEGVSPLMLACLKGETIIVKTLLQAGASVRLTDVHGRDALIYSAETSNNQCAKVALAYGANPSASDDNSCSAVLAAIQNNNVELLMSLIEAGIDFASIDGLNGTPLSLASYHGHSTCINVLLDCGEDPNEFGYFGMPPLCSASYESHVESVTLLLQRGADPNCSSRNGTIPLCMAMERVNPSNEMKRHSIVATLLRRNADPNYRYNETNSFISCNSGRHTAISYAVSSGYISLVHYLLLAGAKVTEPLVEECRVQNSSGSLMYFDEEALINPLQRWMTSVRTLRWHCRKVIRDKLGAGASALLQHLPLPKILKDYLDFIEFENIGRILAPKKKGAFFTFMSQLNESPCSLGVLQSTLPVRRTLPFIDWGVRPQAVMN